MSDEIDEQLDDILTAHRAVLFLNGTPEAPGDAASAMGVDMLTALKIDYHPENVAGRPAAIERLKARANWEKLPQFYIDGQFICDSFVMIGAIQSKQFDTILKDRNIEFDADMAQKIRDANS